MKKTLLSVTSKTKIEILKPSQLVKVKGGDDKRPTRPPGQTPPPGTGNTPNGATQAFD